jgi:MFS family permease
VTRSTDFAPTASQTTAALAAAIALIAAVGIGLSLSLPLLSVEMERMGVSGVAIGISTAVAGLASIALAPKVPQIAARFGPGRVIAAALLACAATLIAFKLTMDYWLWLPLRFVYSASLATLFVLSEYWIAVAAPAARRGFVMGIYASVLSAGFAVGPAILALVGTQGWAPYLAGVSLFGLACLPLLVAWRRLPAIAGKQRHPIAGYLLAAPLAATAGFASGAVETGAIALLPVLGLRLGFDGTGAALLVTAMALGNVVSQIPIGWLSDHVDRRRLLASIAALSMIAVAWLAWIATPGALSVYALVLVWGACVGGFYTVGLAHLAARFTAADLVGANAAFVVMFNVGLLAGPPSIGAALDISTRLGFSIGAAVFALLVVIAAGIEWRRPRT